MPTVMRSRLSLRAQARRFFSFRLCGGEISQANNT